MIHRIDITLNKFGFEFILVCPDECCEQDIHKEQWSDIGMELLKPTNHEDLTILASIQVEPEWTGYGEDAELWLKPVVNDGSES